MLRAMTLRLGLLPPLLLAASCQSQQPVCPAPAANTLGDPTQPMQLEPFYLGADGNAHDAVACGGLDLVFPPQGGHVVFAGVRATNLDGCRVTIAAALRDPSTGSAIGADRRTINLYPIAGRPGWGTASTAGDAMNGFGGVANVAVCPNFGTVDVQGRERILELTVVDASGHRGTISTPVVPRCLQSDPAARAACECDCAHDFSPAKCAPDGSARTDWDAGDQGDAQCAPVDGGAGSGT